MSLAILFRFLCAQHISDINISIIRSLRLCCWITTSVVLFSVRCVLEIWCGWFWVVLVLQAVAQLCFSIPHIKRNGLSARQLKHPVIMIKLLGLPVASFRIRSQNFSQTCCFSVLSICRTSVLLIRKKMVIFSRRRSFGSNPATLNTLYKNFLKIFLPNSRRILWAVGLTEPAIRVFSTEVELWWTVFTLSQ